jgi:hypothetical protein
MMAGLRLISSSNNPGYGVVIVTFSLKRNKSCGEEREGERDKESGLIIGKENGLGKA